MYGDYKWKGKDDTHNLIIIYKTMLIVIDEDRQYGFRFHV